jgi:hypothetical protein
MGTNETSESAPVDAVVITPLEEPIVIDAIRCRLRQDIDIFGLRHSIPTEELRLILDIVDAARHCVREWEPNATEKARGAGTGVGMRSAEDKLIRVLKSGIRSSR